MVLLWQCETSVEIDISFNATQDDKGFWVRLNNTASNSLCCSFCVEYKQTKSLYIYGHSEYSVLYCFTAQRHSM